MFVERTHYYAKPGMVDEVRRTRARACDVREAIGLERGTILHKANPDDDGPDVVWECSFESEAERDRDLVARAASPDFESVRMHMRSCYARFERLFLTVAE